MIKIRIGKIAAVLGTSALLLSGCGLFGPEQDSSSSIDPPPLTETQTPVTIIDEGEELGEAASNQEQAQMIEQTVYVLDANGYVVPLSLPLPKTEGTAKQVLSYMVKGGPAEELLPSGFEAVLPEGTRVLGMTIKEGTATVDFSPQFKNYQPEEEEKIRDAITRALTEFDNIKNVSIWVNGTPLAEMPVSKTPASSLSRAIGVNKELADGAIPGRTTEVTVYFQGQLDEDRTYYVPVTRSIPETNQLAKAVVEELIRGPKEGSPLFSSLLGTTKVLGVEEKQGVLVVNLSDDVLKYDKGREASEEAMQSLVLSLTETTGINKVQVMVEGQPLTAAGSYDFSKPVVRPLHVNPLKS